MQTSPTIENIAGAFVEFQAKVKNPENSKSNPFFKSMYAPLDKILAEARPLLTDNGLSLIQDAYSTDGMVFIHTVLIHTSGEWISTGPLPLMLHPTTKVNEKTGEIVIIPPTPQAQGSALTYARRYALCAILGIAGEEDDDANTAEPPKANVQPKHDAEKTAGGAARGSYNFAKRLLADQGTARRGHFGETEDEKNTRRDDNNLSVSDYLAAHDFPVKGEDALLNLSWDEMSSLIDTLKFEIAEAKSEE